MCLLQLVSLQWHIITQSPQIITGFTLEQSMCLDKRIMICTRHYSTTHGVSTINMLHALFYFFFRFLTNNIKFCKKQPNCLHSFSVIWILVISILKDSVIFDTFLCNSFIVYDVEHLFIWAHVICLCIFGKVCVKIYSIYFIWVVCFPRTRFKRKLDVIESSLHQECLLWILSSHLELVFHYVESLFEKQKLFISMKPSLPVTAWIIPLVSCLKSQCQTLLDFFSYIVF